MPRTKGPLLAILTWPLFCFYSSVVILVAAMAALWNIGPFHPTQFRFRAVPLGNGHLKPTLFSVEIFLPRDLELFQLSACFRTFSWMAVHLVITFQIRRTRWIVTQGKAYESYHCSNKWWQIIQNVKPCLFVYVYSFNGKSGQHWHTHTVCNHVSLCRPADVALFLSFGLVLFFFILCIWIKFILCVWIKSCFLIGSLERGLWISEDAEIVERSVGPQIVYLGIVSEKKQDEVTSSSIPNQHQGHVPLGSYSGFGIFSSQTSPLLRAYRLSPGPSAPVHLVSGCPFPRPGLIWTKVATWFITGKGDKPSHSSGQ